VHEVSENKSKNEYEHSLCSFRYGDLKVLLFRVTTCMENLEVSGNLTAVREMSGILLKVREVSGEKCRKGKVA